MQRHHTFKYDGAHQALYMFNIYVPNNHSYQDNYHNYLITGYKNNEKTTKLYRTFNAKVRDGER